MSKVMDKAFGRSRPEAQIEGEAVERKPTPQEQMMMGVMSKLIPGLDFAAIAKLGHDAEEFAGRVGATLAAHTEALKRIEENQAAILAWQAQHSDPGDVNSTLHKAMTLEVALKIVEDSNQYVVTGAR